MRYLSKPLYITLGLCLLAGCSTTQDIVITAPIDNTESAIITTQTSATTQSTTITQTTTDAPIITNQTTITIIPETEENEVRLSDVFGTTIEETKQIIETYTETELRFEISYESDEYNLFKITTIDNKPLVIFDQEFIYCIVTSSNEFHNYEQTTCLELSTTEFDIDYELGTIEIVDKVEITKEDEKVYYDRLVEEYGTPDAMLDLFGTTYYWDNTTDGYIQFDVGDDSMTIMLAEDEFPLRASAEEL